jgi:hypothetical protein
MPLNENITKKRKPIYHPPIHSFPIYGLVICGVILVLVGIYFKTNNLELSGNDGENIFRINGAAAILFGIAILIFPICVLVKQYREKKSFDRNIF